MPQTIELSTPMTNAATPQNTRHTVNQGFTRDDWDRAQKCPICSKACSVLKDGTGFFCKTYRTGTANTTTKGSNGKTYVFRGTSKTGMGHWRVSVSNTGLDRYDLSQFQESLLKKKSKNKGTQKLNPDSVNSRPPVNFKARHDEFIGWANLSGLQSRDLKNLESRGMSRESIDFMARNGIIFSVDYGDNPVRRRNLPGKWDTKTPGWNGASGLFIGAIQAWEGEARIMGGQIMLPKEALKAAKNKKEDLPKYPWVSIDGNANIPQFGGENPATFIPSSAVPEFYPTPSTSKHIVATEGLLKPLVAFFNPQRHGIDMGLGIFGAAGSSWASSARNQIEKAVKESGAEAIHLALDAGAVENIAVMGGAANLYLLCEELGIDFKIIWYGQFKKSDDDIDELSQPVNYKLLTMADAIELCPKPTDRKTLSKKIEIIEEQIKVERTIVEGKEGYDLLSLVREYKDQFKGVGGDKALMESWAAAPYTGAKKTKIEWRITGDITQCKKDLVDGQLRQGKNVGYKIECSKVDGDKIPATLRKALKAFEITLLMVDTGAMGDLRDSAYRQGCELRKQGFIALDVNQRGCSYAIQKNKAALQKKHISLNVNQEYLDVDLNIFKENRLVAIKSAVGTGKTTLLKKLIKEQFSTVAKTLYIVPNVSLAKAAHEALQADGINSVTHENAGIENLKTADVIVTCYDSLRSGGYFADFATLLNQIGLVVFDEAESGLGHLTQSTTLADKRVEVIQSWQAIVGQKQIIIMDADLTSTTLEAYGTASGYKPYTIVNHFRSGQGRDLNVYGDKNYLLNDFVKAVKKEDAYYCADAKTPRSGISTNATWAVHELLKQGDLPHHTINQDTQGWTDNADFGAMSRLNSLKNSVIASPTISSGVSFDRGSHFKSVWACIRGAVPISTAMQMIARVRDDVPRNVWIESFGFLAMDPKTMDEEEIRNCLVDDSMEAAADVTLLGKEAIGKRLKGEPEVLRRWREANTVYQAEAARDQHYNMIADLRDLGYKVNRKTVNRAQAIELKHFKANAKLLAENHYEAWKEKVASAPDVTEGYFKGKITMTEGEHYAKQKLAVAQWAELDDPTIAASSGAHDTIDANLVEQWDKHASAIDRGGILFLMSSLKDLAKETFAQADLKQFLGKKSKLRRDIRSLVMAHKTSEAIGLKGLVNDLVGSRTNKDEKIVKVFNLLFEHRELIRAATGIKINETSQGKLCQQVAKFMKLLGYDAYKIERVTEDGHRVNCWAFSLNERIHGIWRRRLEKMVRDYGKDNVAAILKGEDGIQATWAQTQLPTPPE